MTNNCFRRHRWYFFRLQKIKRFSKIFVPKDFPKNFKNILWKKCKNAEIWGKKLLISCKRFSRKCGPERTKPDETVRNHTKPLRNHYETITKPSKKSRMHEKDATKPILRACGYIIFNTASADFLVSCVFTSLRDGFVDGFVDLRNRHETITKPSTKPSRNHHIYEILVSGFF